MYLQPRETCFFEEEDLLADEDDLTLLEEEVKKDKGEDSLRIYFSEVFNYKLLTKEDEVQIGKTIEENEKIILKEVLHYPSQVIKFCNLLKKAERENKIFLLFKDYELLEKKEVSKREWTDNLVKKLLDFFDFYEKNLSFNEILYQQIIDKLYEVRPTKYLLDELSCEILETKKFYENFKQIYAKFFPDKESVKLELLFSLNGDRERKLQKLKRSIKNLKNSIKEEFNLKEYQKLMHNLFNALEYLGSEINEIIKSAEKIQQAFLKIKRAKEQLVYANLRLIISIARKYAPKGAIFSDLIQEGNIGLLKAVEKFDYRKGFKFSTYATWWIRQNITRYLAEHTRTIRVPVHIIEAIHKISKIVYTKFYQECGREPTIEELSKETGLSVERLNYIFKIMKHPVSLETTVGEDDDSTLKDFLEDNRVLKPDEATFSIALAEKVRDLLKTLSAREEKVLRLRFGIGERQYYTLEEVGQKFGVTKERIRQIEAHALRKLKHPNRLKLLKNFLYNGT